MRMGLTFIRTLAFCGSLALLSTAAIAQEADAQPTQPSDTPSKAAPPASESTPEANSETAPPADAQPIFARVIEVTGDVRYAPLDSTDWKPVAMDMQLPAETQIRTGLKSAVKFQIGDEAPFTALVIESVGKVVLSEAYRSPEKKRVRIGVSYGKVRAGVAEGGLQSDFTVDTPVATLSKRGTWDFGVRFERPNRFEFFLNDYGLIQVLNRITSDIRTLEPGQKVTEAMRQWLTESRFARSVPVPDIFGQGEIEISFNHLRNSGLGVTDVGGGESIFIDLNNRSARQAFSNLVGNLLRDTTPRITTQGNRTVGPIRRPEGFFGTGRGDQLVPVVIESASSLAQKGYAKPGTYKIRRAALEGWLSKNR